MPTSPPIPGLTELTPANLEAFPCCGIKSPAHEGRRRKHGWLKAHFPLGLCAKAAMADGGKPCGYIEYLPGEYAWRGVDACGYMFIHCVWVQMKQYQRKGLGARMVQACIDDARKAAMKGVAVVTREGPWMAGTALFQANGFEVAGAAQPDYRLLVKKFKPTAAPPVFKDDWEKKVRRYGPGLTIICSDQCPHIAKFVADIAQSAEEDYGIKPNLVALQSHGEAQNAPTPYAVFSLLYHGRVLADHPISRTRFHNIMKKLEA
jgi:GNAT superfamily N-acetyltransferase